MRTGPGVDGPLGHASPCSRLGFQVFCAAGSSEGADARDLGRRTDAVTKEKLSDRWGSHAYLCLGGWEITLMVVLRG